MSQSGRRNIHSRERAGRSGVWHGEKVHAQRAATATATAAAIEAEAKTETETAMETEGGLTYPGPSGGLTQSLAEQEQAEETGWSKAKGGSNFPHKRRKSECKECERGIADMRA